MTVKTMLPRNNLPNMAKKAMKPGPALAAFGARCLPFFSAHSFFDGLSFDWDKQAFLSILRPMGDPWPPKLRSGRWLECLFISSRSKTSLA
jgi:hypothetical protein